jgi:putative transposase
VFVGLDAAAAESSDAWAGFLTDLGAHGLVHRARNVLAKIPKNAQADIKADYWAIFDARGRRARPGCGRVRPGPY